jgi:putative peptidoglycan lipid II flippase
MEFPARVFSIALATVILPSLSRHHAAESKDHFTATLDWALRLVLLLVSPAAVADAGVRRAADRDHVRLRQVRRARRADGELRAHGVLLGTARLQPREGARTGYFARQDTKTPVRVGLIALGVNMAMNVGVALPAVKFGFPYPHILLATSTCMSAAVNTTCCGAASRARACTSAARVGCLAGADPVRERRDGGAAALVGR